MTTAAARCVAARARGHPTIYLPSALHQYSPSLAVAFFIRDRAEKGPVSRAPEALICYVMGEGKRVVFVHRGAGSTIGLARQNKWCVQTSGAKRMWLQREMRAAATQILAVHPVPRKN